MIPIEKEQSNLLFFCYSISLSFSSSNFTDHAPGRFLKEDFFKNCIKTAIIKLSQNGHCVCFMKLSFGKTIYHVTRWLTLTITLFISFCQSCLLFCQYLYWEYFLYHCSKFEYNDNRNYRHLCDFYVAGYGCAIQVKK